MAVQNRADLSNLQLILSGTPYVKDNGTLLTDGARSTVLKTNTVMGQILASKKWVPLTNVAATDGSAIAKGIYVGDDIAAASLVAGDVVNCPILVGGCCTVDSQMLVFENSLTLDTSCGSTVTLRRIEDDLARIGIFAEDTIDISATET